MEYLKFNVCYNKKGIYLLQKEFNNSRGTDDRRQEEETSRNISQHRDKRRKKK
jgi:hypothetical protein